MNGSSPMKPSDRRGMEVRRAQKVSVFLMCPRQRLGQSFGDGEVAHLAIKIAELGPHDDERTEGRWRPGNILTADWLRAWLPYQS